MRALRAGFIAVVVAACGGPTAIGPTSQPPSAPAPTSAASPAATPSTTPAPTAAPTPTPTPSLDITPTVVHIVGAIDDLVGGADPAGWFIAEGNWIADPTNNADVSEPAIGAYLDALQHGLHTALDSGDFAGDIAAMAALRGQIAALAPDAVGAPPPTARPARTVTVKGRGSGNTKPFSLAASDYTVVIVGSGNSNVIANLNPRGGSSLDSQNLFNEISHGRYRYSTVIYGVSAGSYYLETIIDNAWTITFKPLS